MAIQWQSFFKPFSNTPYTLSSLVIPAPPSSQCTINTCRWLGLFVLHILWVAVILLQRTFFQHCWHKASQQFPQEILPAYILLLMAAGKKYKNTTEKIWENSALGTLVLLVITSPFILGLNSEAVALVLRSAKLPAHINTASVSQVPVCKHWTAILFLSASILSFLDAEALKRAVPSPFWHSRVLISAEGSLVQHWSLQAGVMPERTLSCLSQKVEKHGFKAVAFLKDCTKATKSMLWHFLHAYTREATE